MNSAGNHPEIEYVVGGVDTIVLMHLRLRTLAELFQGGDGRWDLGPRDGDFGKPPVVPDLRAVGGACRTLRLR